ncbi:hypothetical protein [Schlesneria paludicola]|uniref:hypothetical protein n=1 Tax=Schlesneria paludicola TaxID=360056 RepID=UPI00029AC027|nr:hypothetical protein [Schlesneria paludicola]
MNVIFFDLTPLTSTLEELQWLAKDANYQSVLDDLQTSASDELAEATSALLEAISGRRTPPTQRTSSNRQLFRNCETLFDENEASNLNGVSPHGLMVIVDPKKALFHQHNGSDDSNHDFYGLSEVAVREFTNRIGDVAVDALKLSQE